jgi:hypothetical protein
MNSDLWFQTLLRLLPALLVTVLAFIAANDPRTRERWANLLYQAGSIRPEQREDLSVQRGVRLPFFIVAAALLIWPILYFRYATRTYEVTSDLYSRPAAPAATPNPNAPTSTVTATPSTSVYGNAVTGNAGPQATSTPGVRTNLYGTPMP